MTDIVKMSEIIIDGCLSLIRPVLNNISWSLAMAYRNLVPK